MWPLVPALTIATLAFIRPSARVRNQGNENEQHIKGASRLRPVSGTLLWQTPRAGETTSISCDEKDDISIWKRLCEAYQIETTDEGILSLRSPVDGLRGLYLNQPVRANDILLAVPLRFCLRDDEPPSWLNKDTVDETSTYGSGSSWAVRLAAALLHRHHLKETNDEIDDPWLAILPTENEFKACLPHHWKEEQVQSAGCIALEMALEGAYFARATALEAVCNAWDNYLDGDGGTQANESSGDRRKLCEWALDIVQTRSCRVSVDSSTDIRLLAPGFDLLNHASPNNAQFNLEGDQLVVRALHDLNENEQVCISYGSSAWPAWKCLASYGFVPTLDLMSDHEEHRAEFFLSSTMRRYVVTPSSIPDDLAEAMVDPDGGEFTPESALALAERIGEAASQLVVTDADVSDIPGQLTLALRQNQREILQSCSQGLRHWAAGDQELQ